MIQVLPLLRRATALVVAASLAAATVIPQEAPPPAAKADGTALTLEALFPKKGLFGPTPSAAEFARSGHFAAWLHVPFAERRHGRDLYLLDTRTGDVRRVTDPQVMATFQRQAREVVADREQKAEKAKPANAAAEADVDPARARARANMHADATIAADDVDAEKAPRYGGVSSFAWSPVDRDELLFVASGDLYRYDAAEDRIERLTKTSQRVAGAQFLPDGSGYTYLDDGRLVRVRFGSHLIEEIQPRFDGDEKIGDYQLSPDGARVVLVTSTGRSPGGGGRRVKIAKYTGRFMEVQEVPRTVSDDPIGNGETKIYLYELDGAMRENGPLYRIHTFKTTGPRDVVHTPEWAPDSSRVVFAVFEQTSSQVELREAVFPVGDEVAKLVDAAKAAKKDRKPEEPIDAPAAVVYRFLHDGGPNTPRMIEPAYLADSRRVLFLGEQSGFRHLHVLDPLYQTQRQLTWGPFEVYPIRQSFDRTHVFVAATKEHPSRLDVYDVDVESGAMTRLTARAGNYDAATVDDTGRVLATFSSWHDGPPELCWIDGSGAEVTLTDSHTDAARGLATRAPELFTFANRRGQAIHGFLFEPERPAGELRPLLVYVYGGPLGTRKNVVDGMLQSDAYLFARYMTEVHGYVTCTIDPRGMSGYGALFEKANFEQVGRPQVEDLVDGVRHLIATHGVDPHKVGIHGWSFGGFQTQMCLYTEPDVFQVGIAGAGPTEWQNYNSWYSTGTIGPSREGTPDLEKYSLLPLAKNLKGKLLLVHGMEDSNVLYQDTVRVYRELLKAQKEALVELFLDPTGGHGLGGDVERLGRARKYEEFLVRTLGSTRRQSS